MIARTLNKMGKGNRNESQALRREKAPVEVEKRVECSLMTEMPTELEVGHIDLEAPRIALHELLSVVSINAEVVKQARSRMYLGICHPQFVDDEFSEFRFDLGLFHGKRAKSPNDPRLSDAPKRFDGAHD